MKMAVTEKFALVEFNDNSLAVVQSTDIDGYTDENQPDVGSDCVVLWKASGKKKASKHAAVVLRFGDESNLKEDMKRLEDGHRLEESPLEVGRGKREKKRKEILSSEDDEDISSQRNVKKTKTSSKGQPQRTKSMKNLLERVRNRWDLTRNEQVSEVDDASQQQNPVIPVAEVEEKPTDINLKMKVEMLQEENCKLKSALAAVNILPDLVKRLESALAATVHSSPTARGRLSLTPSHLASKLNTTPQSTKSVTTPSSTTSSAKATSMITKTAPKTGPRVGSVPIEKETQCVSDDDLSEEPKMLDGDDDLLNKLLVISRNASRLNAAKMTNDLLHGLFSTEYMACHSVAGGNKEKPALPGVVVEEIIKLVQQQFAEASPNEIRSFMRQKLSNAVKILKHRSKKQE